MGGMAQNLKRPALLSRAKKKRKRRMADSRLFLFFEACHVANEQEGFQVCGDRCACYIEEKENHVEWAMSAGVSNS